MVKAPKGELTGAELRKLIRAHNILVSIKIPAGTDREGLIKLIEGKGYKVDHKKKAIIDSKKDRPRRPKVTLDKAKELTKPKPKTALQKQKAVEAKAEKAEKKKKEERVIRKKAVEEEKKRAKPKPKPKGVSIGVGTDDKPKPKPKPAAKKQESGEVKKIMTSLEKELNKLETFIKKRISDKSDKEPLGMTFKESMDKDLQSTKDKFMNILEDVDDAKERKRIIKFMNDSWKALYSKYKSQSKLIEKN